jgi:hypothetical protein
VRERRRAARRDADHHHLGQKRARRRRGARRATARGRRRGQRRRRARGLRRGGRRRDHLADQLRADLGQLGRHLARGLLHEVDRARGQRLERLARALARVRREHHHRRRAEAHDLAHRLRSVEPGHVEVHGAHVGRERAHLVDGVAPVLGLAHDLDARLALEQLLDRRAHEQRIIGHQDADLAHPILASGWPDRH